MKQLIDDIQAEINDAKGMKRHWCNKSKREYGKATQFLAGLERAMKHVKFHIKQHEICCTKTEL